MSDAELQQGNTRPDHRRVPLWLAASVVGLAIAAMVLAGMLIRLRIIDDAGDAPDARIRQLEVAVARDATPDTLLELGYEYRKAGRNRDALRIERRVLQLDKGNVAARYHIGAILIEQGEEAEAERILWEALDFDRTHAMSAKALGELYARRGKYKSLLEAVEPAASASPQLADLQYLLGLGKEKTGDTAGAAAAYENAVQNDPGFEDAWTALDRVGGRQQ